jgi:AmiR/NasT family two-component response regulator
VVEDEVIVSADLQDQLLLLGYQVVGAAVSGEEAIEKARALGPDLVLMDIILKGAMDGIQAAAHIRDELHLPVIFLTANSNDSVLERAKISEPFGYLLKPFDQRSLKSNIEMALYKARSDREREELIRQLQEALMQVKMLSGLLPICAWCKNVRDDNGYWKRVEEYIQEHSEAKFSHGLCPDCAAKHFGAQPEVLGGSNG